MKTLSLFFTVLIFTACTSEDPGPNPVQSGTISFKVNGSQFTFTGMYGQSNPNYNTPDYEYASSKKIIGSSNLPPVIYNFTAQKGTVSSTQKIFNFWVAKDTLTLGTYHYDSTTAGGNTEITWSNNSTSHVLAFAGDTFSCTIASYANGKINGTFKAKLTPITGGLYGIHGSTLITDGIINNVPVIY